MPSSVAIKLNLKQSLRKFLQEEDCYLQAGKIKVLMSLLERYKKEGRRVLVFSQVRPVWHAVLTGHDPRLTDGGSLPSCWIS